MKLKTTISFLILCAALFFIGCSDGNKTDYQDENDADAIGDTDFANDDSDTSENTDTDSDNDTDTVSDESDTVSDNETDSDEPSDDADSAEDHPDADDSDSTSNDTDYNEPSDDADSAEDHPDADNSDSASNDTDSEDQESDDDPIPESDNPEVLCSGQDKCFNNRKEITCPTSVNQNFFGQDAQYAAKNYCLKKIFYVPENNEEVVVDKITGLVWQRNLPSTYSGCSGSEGQQCSYSEAVNYCSNLKLNYNGELSGWRLPTPAEFGTIIDYSETNPSINTEVFSKTPAMPFWTFGNKLSVEFVKGETKVATFSYLYVRCVKEEWNSNAPSFEIDEEKEIVIDSVHNLTWTKSFADLLTWKESLEYCSKLNQNNNANEKYWRLPNINELKTLINYSKSKPASDFPGMMISATFFTSTSYSNSGNQAWTVTMDNGTSQLRSKDDKYSVICVR